jgi:nucleoid-associated protein YgaU
MVVALDLSKEVGGVPVGVLGVVVAGGLAVGWYFNKRAANKNTASQLTESGVGAGGSGGFADVNPPAEGEKPAETNQAWQTKATNWLISQGTDPLSAGNAIQKYLTGQTLNVVEQAIVKQALLHFGSPPESLPGPGNQGPPAVTLLAAKANPPPAGRTASVTLTWLPSPGATSYDVTVSSQYGNTTWNVVAPPYTNLETGADTQQTWTVIAKNDYGQSDPVSTQVKTPPLGGGGGGGLPPVNPPGNPPPSVPAQRTYAIVRGDTLWAIAGRFYGAPTRWREIYNRNSGVIEAAARQHGKANSSQGTWIYPGTVLVIP